MTIYQTNKYTNKATQFQQQKQQKQLELRSRVYNVNHCMNGMRSVHKRVRDKYPVYHKSDTLMIIKALWLVKFMLITGPASLCRIMTLVSLMIGVLISKVNCRYCCCCLFFFRSELSTAIFIQWLDGYCFLTGRRFICRMILLMDWHVCVCTLYGLN